MPGGLGRRASEGQDARSERPRPDPGGPPPAAAAGRMPGGRGGQRAAAGRVGQDARSGRTAAAHPRETAHRTFGGVMAKTAALAERKQVPRSGSAAGASARAVGRAGRLCLQPRYGLHYFGLPLGGRYFCRSSTGTISRSFAMTMAGVASPLSRPALTSWFLMVFRRSQPLNRLVVLGCPVGSGIVFPRVKASFGPFLGVCGVTWRRFATSKCSSRPALPSTLGRFWPCFGWRTP